MERFAHHYEEQAKIQVSVDDLFSYVDDHARFSSHMNKSSLMMGGGRMNLEVDDGHGQIVGSHIRMMGTAFGFKLFLDEVVTRHEPPRVKTWETVGSPKLLIIGQYGMGIDIQPQGDHSLMRVYIDYSLPTKNAWLGKLFSAWYAKWCVQQMLNGARAAFRTHQE